MKMTRGELCPQQPLYEDLKYKFLEELSLFKSFQIAPMFKSEKLCRH